MKHTVKRALILLLAVVMLTGSILLTGCDDGRKKIVIYSSAEDFRIDYMQQRLDAQFPDYNIVIQRESSGNHAAKLNAGAKDCHISHDIEYGYALQLSEKGVYADLTNIADFSVYTEDALVSTYFSPKYRNGAAIILNMDVIAEKGLDIPSSYEDLLDPQYKNLISMPNPKASGTGYIFLLNLVNEWGEERAFAYFDQLSENILHFTSSGSGPVNDLVNKETAIGLGITAHAVQEINNGENLRILFFEEGSPFTFYGQGIIAGNETDEAVVEVFRFLSGQLTQEMCERFTPEKLYKDKDYTVTNYPSDIIYADMTNNTPERKEALLDKWMH